jgi:hypothetical protein
MLDLGRTCAFEAVRVVLLLRRCLHGLPVRTEAGPVGPVVGPAEVRGFVTSFVVSV